MPAMRRQRNRRRPMAEINVVPYIDVMLVLLVIFMITAPLLTEGVKVELPAADAEPMQEDMEEPVVVTVDIHGNFYVDVGEEKSSPVNGEVLVERIQKVLAQNPKVSILVRGDRNVDYGRVVDAMVRIQSAGAPGVGLITEPPQE